MEADVEKALNDLADRLHHVTGPDAELGLAYASLHERVARMEKTVAFIEYLLEELLPGRLKKAKDSIG